MKPIRLVAFYSLEQYSEARIREFEKTNVVSATLRERVRARTGSKTDQ